MRKILEISSLKREIVRFPVLKGSKRLNIYGFQVKAEFNSKMNLGEILVTTNIDSNGELILLSENCCEVKDYGLYYEINEIHHLSEEIEYSFCYIDNGKLLNGKILMEYEFSEIPIIPILNPNREFLKHLSKSDNAKIVFSAPFGSGKSYFLTDFFKHRESEYEVFKVYPVNYSVASNEDIFKYIKADLLFQLMGKDVDFDKEGITFYQAIHEYVYLNPFKTLINFVEQVSKLHPKTELIGKSVTALKTFLTPFVEKVKQYQASQEIDDKKKSLDFIQQLYEFEGSI